MIGAFIALTLLASISHSHRQPIGQEAVVIEQVLLRENQLADGQVKKDLPELRSLLAGDFRETNENGANRSKEQFLADVSRSATLQSFEVTDRHVRVRGKKAVVTAQYILHGIRTGKRFVESGRFVDTWINWHGEWYCTASHSQSAFQGIRP